MKSLSCLLFLFTRHVIENAALHSANEPMRWKETNRWRNMPRDRPTYSRSLSYATRSIMPGGSAAPEQAFPRRELPPGIDVLSRDPLVYVVPSLLSSSECRAYQQYVENLELQNRTMTRSNPPEVTINIQKLWPLPILSLLAGIPQLFNIDHGASFSEIKSAIMPPILIAFGVTVCLAYLALPLTQMLSNRAARTSDAMALNLIEDMAFVKEFINRVQDITGHPWDCWEAPVVTRYAPGATFSRHSDASPTRGSEWEDLGGQRIITCICYLNDIHQGGETYFDKLGFGVTPKQGCALVFFPSHWDTLNADDRTTHESLPPPLEEKWIVQMFGRVQRVPYPLGLPDAFSTICTK